MCTFAGTVWVSIVTLCITSGTKHIGIFDSLNSFIDRYAVCLYHTTKSDTAYCRLEDLQQMVGFRQPLLTEDNMASYVLDLMQDPSVRFIPFQQLQSLNIIGRGGFGEVYAATWEGIPVAVKKLFKLQSMQGPRHTEGVLAFIKEARLLSRLRHPNVVLFLGVSLAEGQEAIVTEYMSQGSLFDLMEGCRLEADALALAEEEKVTKDVGKDAVAVVDAMEGGATTETGLSALQRHSAMAQAAAGMAYLHGFQPAIIHRDLKSGK